MKTIAFVALAAATAVVPEPIPVAEETQTVDMADLTCADIAGEEDITFYIAWVDGYLRGRSGETTVAVDWFQKLSEHVATACGSDGERTVVGIVEGFTGR